MVDRGHGRAAARAWVLLIWLALALFVHARYGDAPAATRHDARFWNGEVSLHFLNILGRYEAAPIGVHWFAPSAPCVAPPAQPCVRSAVAGQPGTAILASARLGGQVMYTSFPPGAMMLASPVVLPLAQATDLPPLTVLRLCNLLLALLTVLLCLGALDRLLAPALPGRAPLLVAGCLPLLASVEVLHSHHLPMWSHQVLQPFLAALLLLALGAMHTRRALCLGVLAAVACWVEWAAYIACIALQAIVIVRSPSGQRWRNGAAFAGTALFGGLSLLAWYAFLLGSPADGGWRVGLSRYGTALRERLAARSVLDVRHDAADWFQSQAQSWLPWMLAALLLRGAELWRRRAQSVVAAAAAAAARDPARAERWAAAFALCLLPLYGNVLLFEHAIVYTFDRLKWGFLFALVLAFLGERLVRALGPRAALAVLALALLAGGGAVLQLGLLYVPYW